MFAALFLSHFLLATDVSVEDKLLARRAPECAGLAKQSENLWDSAKKPAIRLHCARLKDAYSMLALDAYVSAMERATIADSLSPGLAGPLVVRGIALERCFLAQNTCGITEFPLADFPKKSLEAFDSAQKLDARALDDALVGFEHAIALQLAARTADSKLALAALGQRVTGVFGLCAPVEACESLATFYMVVSTQWLSAGPTSIDNAMSALRESHRVMLQFAPFDREVDIEQKRLRAMIWALEALAADRKGSLIEDQLKQAESEVKYLEQATSAQSRLRLYVADPNELLAARAMVLQRTQPKAALALWNSYVTASPSSPWAAHAKARIASLETAK